MELCQFWDVEGLVGSLYKRKAGMSVDKSAGGAQEKANTSFRSCYRRLEKGDLT